MERDVPAPGHRGLRRDDRELIQRASASGPERGHVPGPGRPGEHLAPGAAGTRGPLRGNCAPEDGGDPPDQLGLLQIKWYYNRTAYPMLRTITPFHLDWYGAKLRGCYDGRKRHPAGDIWGCVGEWFSGSWNDSGAIAYVRA